MWLKFNSQRTNLTGKTSIKILLHLNTKSHYRRQDGLVFHLSVAVGVLEQSDCSPKSHEAYFILVHSSVMMTQVFVSHALSKLISLDLILIH